MADSRFLLLCTYPPHGAETDVTFCVRLATGSGVAIGNQGTSKPDCCQVPCVCLSCGCAFFWLPIEVYPQLSRAALIVMPEPRRARTRCSQKISSPAWRLQKLAATTSGFAGSVAFCSINLFRMSRISARTEMSVWAARMDAHTLKWLASRCPFSILQNSWWPLNSQINNQPCVWCGGVPEPQQTLYTLWDGCIFCLWFSLRQGHAIRTMTTCVSLSTSWWTEQDANG